MAANRGGGWSGPAYRMQIDFRVPLDFAFAWCTDYSPEDGKLDVLVVHLTKESHQTSRRLRGSRGDEGRMDLVAGRRRPEPSEAVAHGWGRQPSRLHGGLRPDAPHGRPDPAGPAVEATPAESGGREAHKGAAGGVRASIVEALPGGDGAGLPAKPTRSEQVRHRTSRSGPTTAMPS